MGKKASRIRLRLHGSGAGGGAPAKSPGGTAATQVSPKTAGHTPGVGASAQEGFLRGPQAEAVAGAGSSGQPLTQADRAYFEPRLGRDLSGVRVRDGAAAAGAAQAMGAEAFAFGSDLGFAPGRYRPGSSAGRRLLAHELAHVALEGSREGRSPARVRRQVTPGSAAPATTPTWSVSRSVFQSRLSRALNQMTTSTVAAHTLSGTLEPILRSLAADAEWRDSAGTSSGGNDVTIARPGPSGQTVRLRLILDDTAAPPATGMFEPLAPDAGVIRVYIRDNDSADMLSTTLYHESLHLMRWLAAHSPGGDFLADTGATGGRRETLEGIDPARHPRHLASVRAHVARLAAATNAARPSGDTIGAAGIDRVAAYVMEEYLVRLESEVYRLMRDSDAAARDPRPTVRSLTSAELLFPLEHVYRYLFEFNPEFRAADRASLSGFDRQEVADLYAFFRDRADYFIRLRYSEVMHGPAYRMRRPDPYLAPRLPHRSFIPELTRSVDEAGL